MYNIIIIIKGAQSKSFELHVFWQSKNSSLLTKDRNQRDTCTVVMNHKGTRMFKDGQRRLSSINYKQ